MADNVAKCPLCGGDANRSILPGRAGCTIQCRTCGEFTATAQILEYLKILRDQAKSRDRELLPYLRAHTRQESEAGRPVTLTTKNWRNLTSTHAHTPLSRKLEKVLEYLGRCSRYPGHSVALDFQTDYPLFDARSQGELVFLFRYLQDRGLVQPDAHRFLLTVEGWARLEPTASGGFPGHVFVAMSFEPSLNPVYEQGIKPAIEVDCNLKAVRVDKVEHNEKICDRILAEIKKAQFLVADFTQHKAGVYFEAGYAMGLGRPVIWTCREDELKRTHFDTRQYNHVTWKTPEELRQRLADRIRATILQ